MSPKNVHPTDQWFRQALAACDPGPSASLSSAVLSRIGGRTPGQLEDLRRARLFKPATAVAAALLMGLWTLILINDERGERGPRQPIEQVQFELAPVLVLEEEGFPPEESGAPMILSALLTGEFSE